MKKPVLSVITVTFNASQTLPATLRSIAEQTYPHIEYIVVDGASRDNTLEVIRTSSVAVAHLVSEPDKGLYDAMNKAVRLASGDYLCFLNAGDAFSRPDTVEQMMTSFSIHNQPDILYGETAIVDYQGKFLGMRHHRAPEHLTWKSFRKGMLVCHQAFIVRRTLFEPYDLRYRFSADVDWCIRLMKRAERIHNTHLTLISYLNEGMTTANHRASLVERFKIMAHHYGYLPTIFYHAQFCMRGLLKMFYKGKTC